MASILQTYKRFFYTLLAVFFSFSMFSNTTEVLFTTDGMVIKGLENIYVTPIAPAEVGVMYISIETVFYKEGTITAKVVFLSAKEEAPKHNQRVTSKYVKNQSNAVTKDVVLTSMHGHPFSGSSRNLFLFSNELTCTVVFAGKNSKKNKIIYSLVSLYTKLYNDLFDGIVAQNNNMYNRFGLQYASNVNATFFTRPPPILRGDCS